VEAKFLTKKYEALKKEVADILIDKLAPFRERKESLVKRDVYIKEILAQGAKKAHRIAYSTMQDVREKVGLLASQSNG
ncbi:MAG: tryptophan--tRNA ligase, partial [bacterium]|nr:tryptophan--tRNA ligase [bacterium]